LFAVSLACSPSILIPENDTGFRNVDLDPALASLLKNYLGKPPSGFRNALSSATVTTKHRVGQLQEIRKPLTLIYRDERLCALPHILFSDARSESRLKTGGLELS
jgi:hypothetical protein